MCVCKHQLAAHTKSDVACVPPVTVKHRSLLFSLHIIHRDTLHCEGHLSRAFVL